MNRVELCYPGCGLLTLGMNNEGYFLSGNSLLRCRRIHVFVGDVRIVGSRNKKTVRARIICEVSQVSLQTVC